MKTKIMQVFSSAFLLSAATLSIASAQVASTVNVNVGADIEVRMQGNSTSTAAKNDYRGNATGTDSTNDHATSTSAEAEGQLNAEAHRSTVASFVKSLLSVADREGGIGVQVRAIAKAQNDSASTSADAIAKVEQRGGTWTFLFGSDYKSLGQLRSEIATTQNNIDQLKNLLTKTASAADKAELTVQIKALQDSQVQLDAFVTAHENSFSLFGWFFKLFNQ